MTKNPLNRLQAHWPNGVTREREPALDEAQPWTTTIQPWVERLEEIVGQHPRATLAAAATVGIFLGWLVKRK